MICRDYSPLCQMPTADSDHRHNLAKATKAGRTTRVGFAYVNREQHHERKTGGSPN